MSFLSNIISASFLCNSLFSGFVRYLTHLFRLISLIFHWFYALCIVLWSGKVLLNINDDYYAALYDDVIIPDELADIHPKAAIKYRNRWMIDHSDIILIYTKRTYGGAYEARRYAERIGKEMVYISAK